MKKDKKPPFFTEAQEDQIIAAIKEAEKNTSGEVRVHLENIEKPGSFERATEIFEKAGMTKTKLRNGVMFYVAPNNHHFSILGDTGINEKVSANFWDDIKNKMQQAFSKGDFANGVAEGVREAGLALQEFFPYQDDDVNELPDEISKS